MNNDSFTKIFLLEFSGKCHWADKETNLAKQTLKWT